MWSTRQMTRPATEARATTARRSVARPVEGRRVLVHRTVSSLCYSRVVVPSGHATSRAAYFAELGHRYDVASLGPFAVDAAGSGAAEPHRAGCQHRPVESADRRDAPDSGGHGRQMASAVRDVGHRRLAGCAACWPPAEARARRVGAYPGACLPTAGGLQPMDGPDAGARPHAAARDRA